MGRTISIEVIDVWKSFEVAAQRASLRERLRGGRRPSGRTLEVLKGISFDVYRGEFFGIVGRNGSGKSTLLKMLASVYRADRGRVRIAGRLAPFLELGVGFNMQLPARENVILNGVMMGLTPHEAERRCAEVIDFADLREFTDLQLKNYSSGMKVRLAFAALTQVDADVLLLDEVLAVGDAAFAERCERVFKRMRAEGTTIVLVTHSMPTVNAECDRAMVIHEGVIDRLGAPLEVSNRYMEINMRAAAESSSDEDMGDYAARFARVIADPPIEVLEAHLEGERAGDRSIVPENAPLEIGVLARVVRPVARPGFQFRIDDARGQPLFQSGAADLELDHGEAAAGDELEVQIRVDNRLVPGDYAFTGGITQRTADGSTEPATPAITINVTVMGEERPGLLALDHDVKMRRRTASDRSGSAGR